MTDDALLERELALFEGMEDEEASTIGLDKPGHSGYSGETTSTGGRSKHMSMDLAGSVFLIASNGRMLSLPIPSESPYDPLDWTQSRRVFIWTLLLIYSIIAMFLIQTPGNLFQALLAEFDGEVCIQYCSHRPPAPLKDEMHAFVSLAQSLIRAHRKWLPSQSIPWPHAQRFSWAWAFSSGYHCVLPLVAGPSFSCPWSFFLWPPSRPGSRTTSTNSWHPSALLAWQEVQLLAR